MDFIFRLFGSVLRRTLSFLLTSQARLRLGSVGRNFKMIYPCSLVYYKNVYMGNNVFIDEGSQFVCENAKIIIKDNTQIGNNVLMVSGNHNIMEIGKYINNSLIKHPINDKDIIINEDVFIIYNVTLLSGVIVGRGAVVGTGSVVRNSVPPYAIVFGNPAKVIGFRFTPKQIIEHEMKLYEEKERLSIEELEKNYKKYFLDRLREIMAFMN
jgi:acetyltransferase-like isoleucine patch superfamily enzyme